ncbi:hypothetical protein B0H19DRAFT_1071208 [Mycena capillaripes]|nr:hypothetical protein B0H19DRAFT_1071208 [Mycena capillaripes]
MFISFFHSIGHHAWAVNLTSQSAVACGTPKLTPPKGNGSVYVSRNSATDAVASSRSNGMMWLRPSARARVTSWSHIKSVLAVLPAPHGVPHWDPVTLYAVSSSADNCSRTPSLSADNYDVAFVDTEMHSHTVFVGLRVPLYIACG